MAKRYSDSRKWKKAWFRKLTHSEKLFWIFLLDECDHAGIWEVDFDFASLFITDIEEKTIRAKFEKQYIEIDNGKRWFIKDFVKFQYGKLSPTNRVHQSVLDILIDYGLDKDLKRPVNEPKDKDEDQAKVKVKVKKTKQDQLLEIGENLIVYQKLNNEADAPKEFEKFKNYLEANGKTYKNYSAAFRNWMQSGYVKTKSGEAPFVRDPEFIRKCPKCDYKRKTNLKTYAVCPTHNENLL